MEDDDKLIKAVLHNPDGTVDYVFNNDVLDEILKPYMKPDIFCEEYLGVKLHWWQKIVLRMMALKPEPNYTKMITRGNRSKLKLYEDSRGENTMFERNENGKLQCNPIMIQVMFDDMLEICQTREEVQWAINELASNLAVSATDTLDELNDPDPYDIEIELY